MLCTVNLQLCVRDPPILILDETTASVDTATEKPIQEALERLMASGGLYSQLCRVQSTALAIEEELDGLLATGNRGA